MVGMPEISPKDRFITVYGRNPVLEALSAAEVTVDKVLLADTMTCHPCRRSDLSPM